MVEIPHRFCHPVVYKKGTIISVVRDKTTDLRVPFLADILYMEGLTDRFPPDHAARDIPVMLNQWTSIKEILADKFEQRQLNGAEEEMRFGIAFAIQWIHWMNGKTVDMENIQHFDQWKVHPVNCSERIQFILSRPVLYHSYVQLCELIEELEKQFYKLIAIKGIRKAPSAVNKED